MTTSRRFRVGSVDDTDADLLRKWGSVLMGDPDGQYFVVDARGRPLARYRDADRAQEIADQVNAGRPALA